MGTLETLEGKDKLYSVLRRGPTYLDGVAPNAVNDRIYGETAAVLMPTLTGDGPTFKLSVHDDVVARAADLLALQLHIEIAHWAPQDEVEVSLDGNVLAPPAIVRQLQTLVPGSQYVEIKGPGHSVYFEAPDAFNEAVESFLLGAAGAA